METRRLKEGERIYMRPDFSSLEAYRASLEKFCQALGVPLTMTDEDWEREWAALQAEESAEKSD